MNSKASPPEGKSSARDAAYWRVNLIVIGVLLFVWFVVSYCCSIFFVEQLNEYKIGQIPLGFWFGHQGSIVIYVVLILIYAVGMDIVDRKFGLQSGSDS